MADEGEPIIEPQAIASQPLKSDLKVDFNPLPETREWKIGLFSCTDDLMTCLCGAVCPCYLATKISKAIKECPLVWLLVAGLPLRLRLRYLYGIKGSILKDWFVSNFCLPCSLCQMHRELESNGHL